VSARAAPRLTLRAAAVARLTACVCRRGMTDLVLLAARTEDDVSHLEVWVYEEASTDGGESNLFVHHDLLLPGARSAAAPACGACARALLRLGRRRVRTR
jgi:hypothetical protein